MRDYWLTQELLRAVGYGYIALSLLGVVLALWLPKGKWAKLMALGVVAFLISIPVRQGVKEYEQATAAKAAYQARYAHAQALFAERCKTAGEKISRTVEGVEGVLLMKARPKEINLDNQYRLDDPFGADCHGQQCIEDLLRVSEGADRNPKLTKLHEGGFAWVDAMEDGQRNRYVGIIRVDQRYDLYLKKTPVDEPLPRYGVTWDDISTQEDRDVWIAGGSLKIVDLSTSEVIAERVGYMMDPGLGAGATGGFRSPWGFAYDKACPKFPSASGGGALRGGNTRRFVLSVLQSKQGN